jgi:hypothetical protein
MSFLRSPHFVPFHRSKIARSVAVGLSLGILLVIAIGGCNNSSPPASPQGKAPPPPTESAVADLPQTSATAEMPIPAWVGQQQNEPFPVRQYLESRAAPPDNAAPLYFAALAEVSPEMYVPNPPASWPWDQKRIPEHVREFDRAAGKLSDRDKLLQGPVSEADIESLLTKAQPALKKLDDAQQKPRCVFVTGICIESRLPHTHAARDFGYLARIQLCHARMKGSFDEAEQAVRRTLRLSRDLRPRGALIPQLISNNLDVMVLTSITDFTLGQQGLTAKDCERLLALLAEHERDVISSADEGLRMEYIVTRNTLDRLQRQRTSAADLAALSAGAGHPINQIEWPAEIAVLNSAFASAIALAAAPYDQAKIGQWDADEMGKAKARSAVVTLLFLPTLEPFLQAITRGRAQLAGVTCLTAVRRYKLTHGSLPENLEVAAREAGLKAVPTDPYSGGPMHYKVIDGKPVVYSVGSDGKDDGGTVDWEYGKKRGDYIFRIRE